MENLPPNYALQQGEQMLWLHQVKKGVFHKELVEEWIITNFRAMKRFPLSSKNPRPKVVYAGLRVSACVVVSEFRRAQGNRIGSFTGESTGGTFAGTGSSFSRSTSRSYGDLVFLVNGKEILQFRGISDPRDVERLVQTLQEQMRKT